MKLGLSKFDKFMYNFAGSGMILCSVIGYIIHRNMSLPELSLGLYLGVDTILTGIKNEPFPISLTIIKRVSKVPYYISSLASKIKKKLPFTKENPDYLSLYNRL